MKTLIKLGVLALLALNAQLSTLNAQTTAFTYQGRLNDGTNPATGIYDLRFAIYDADSGGAQQGALITNSPTGVTNGLFTVTLDFGNQFPGADRWLEIAVQTNGGASFLVLSPRQPLTPTPYAIMAGSSSNVLGTLSPTALAGTYSSPVSFTNTGNSFSGTFVGSGAGLTNLNAWQLGGNAGTTPGTQFIGTTDEKSLYLKIGNIPALILDYKTNDLYGYFGPNIIAGGGHELNPSLSCCTIAGGCQNEMYSSEGAIGGGFRNKIFALADDCIIGGGRVNEIYSQAASSVISGGVGNRIWTAAFWSSIVGGGQNEIGAHAASSTIGGGEQNQVQDRAYGSVIGGGYMGKIGYDAVYSTISGGWANVIQSSSGYAMVAGGSNNNIGTNAPAAAIAGGDSNQVGANADRATVGGGAFNQANNSSATVAGGYANTALANASTISGGQNNDIGLGSSHAVVGGGLNNNIGEGAFYSTISGGDENTIEDTASYSTIAGGFGNIIQYGTGSSVIGGGGGNVISNSASYVTIAGGQFNSARGHWSVIGGGYGNQISWGAENSVIPGGINNLANGSHAFAAGTRAKANHQGAFVWADSQDADFSSLASDTVSFRCQGGVSFASGADWGSIPNQRVSWNPGGASWIFLSDRNSKDRITPVSPLSVLEKLARIPIAEWSYIGYDQRHIGPMAQDFHTEFPLNDNDKALNDADLHGVALAAIQGLNEKLESDKRKAETDIEMLKSENAALNQQLAELRALVEKLAQRK